MSIRDGEKAEIWNKITGTLNGVSLKGLRDGGGREEIKFDFDWHNTFMGVLSARWKGFNAQAVLFSVVNLLYIKQYSFFASTSFNRSQVKKEV